MMKSIKLMMLSAIMTLTFQLSAQSSNVQTANISLNDNDLKDAKKYIDLAAANESTKNDPKMFFVKGDVYFRLALDTTEKTLIYRVQDNAMVYKALEAYINCLKSGNEKYSKLALNQIAGDLGKALGIGAVAYNEAMIARDNQVVGKDPHGFETAIKYFDLLLSAFPYDKANKIKAGNSELTINQITKNAGKAAYYKKDWPLVTKYLGKLASESFIDPDLYITLSKAFQEQGDTATAIKYVEQGRELKSDNQDLINEELFLYSRSNQADKLVDKLSKAIESDPTNAKYYYYRASTYEGLFKNNDKRTDYMEKAELDYKESIKLDAGDADVNIALGIFYFNKAVPVINERENTDNVKQKKKFDDLNIKASELLNSAIKYYEAANTIRPNDVEILNFCKLTYAQLGQEQKVVEIGNKIKALNKAK